MSTVAPSAPAPAVVDAAASGAKGETADPAAFAAEFESALGELTAATTAPTDAAAALPADPTAPVPAEPALPAPATTSAPALPSQMTEIAPAASPVLPEVALPAAPVSVVSDDAQAVGEPAVDSAGAVSAAVSVAAAEIAPADDSENDDSDEATDAAAAAPAADLAPVLALPLPAPVVTAAAPTAVETDAPAPTAVGAVTAPAATDSAAAAAPADAPAAAPASAVPAAPAVFTLQAPDEVAAPAAPARVAAPDLVGQLARPLHGLRSFGDGTHIITVRVTPENLGPVAVRAHVSGDSMRIELVAPTDIARDAIKAILPDLRRDLSGAGGQATLDLSSGNQPSGRESAPRDAPAQSRGNDSAAVAPAPGIRSALRHDVGLDVLA